MELDVQTRTTDFDNLQSEMAKMKLSTESTIQLVNGQPAILNEHKTAAVAGEEQAGAAEGVMWEGKLAELRREVEQWRRKVEDRGQRALSDVFNGDAKVVDDLTGESEVLRAQFEEVSEELTVARERFEEATDELDGLKGPREKSNEKLATANSVVDATKVNELETLKHGFEDVEGKLGAVTKELEERGRELQKVKATGARSEEVAQVLSLECQD
ncbi:hypothetical protein HK097_003142 [Rhizophlyctis rosea]|uniref:Uncharacterized protein n=1 Tax=Rhizophlyctis rosea TaxID=64517 RepID=A0AAD5X087_9FUNG|nr:hypothetical protein HK097_003142 [Rhizophlyctis rosea]